MSDMKQISPARRRLYMFLSEYWIVFVFLLIYMIFVILEPLCFSLAFLSSTLNYMAEILILGVGVMFVVITAGIDLSIGPVEGAVGVGSALAMRALVPVIGVGPAIAVGVLVGILMGMVIGFGEWSCHYKDETSTVHCNSWNVCYFDRWWIHS